MARDHRRLAAIVSLDVAGYSRLVCVDESGTLAALNEFAEGGDGNPMLAAAIHYQLAQFEPSAQMGRKAITELDKDSLGNPRLGAVALTLVAAEARMGRLSRAKVALADFNAAVPGVATIAAIRTWMHSGAELAGYEPMFEGSRLAGVPD